MGLHDLLQEHFLKVKAHETVGAVRIFLCGVKEYRAHDRIPKWYHECVRATQVNIQGPLWAHWQSNYE
jgi:hypothetical protein